MQTVFEKLISISQRCVFNHNLRDIEMIILYTQKIIIMKKIIIPFSGEHFSEGAFSFASALNSLKPILLTGIFLPEVDYAQFFFFPESNSTPVFVPLLEHFDEQGIENNVKKFSENCQKSFIEYSVHKNLYDFAIPNLTKETRFADAMIIGVEKFFREAPEKGTDEYLKDTLHNTECPVFIVPEKFNFPSTIILAYDGSESSVFSIKQFACLLPELCDRKTILLHVGRKVDEETGVERQSETFPDKLLAQELAARHFKDLTITTIYQKKDGSIADWLKGQDNPLVVSGSFGRSGLSEFFRKNFVLHVIKKGLVPAFIAHR